MENWLHKSQSHPQGILPFWYWTAAKITIFAAARYQKGTML